MTTLTIPLRDDLLQDIDNFARKEDRSREELLGEAIEIYLRERKLESARAADAWFENGSDCPICAKHSDPATGNLRFNAETLAAFKEGDAMLAGEAPANWHRSVEDLDEMLGL